MKTIYSIFLLLICTLRIQSQSMFFDSLPSSNWKSTDYINESLILKTKKIGLIKQRQSLDSLKQASTVWIFKEYIVVIKYIQPQIKKDSLLVAYRYEIDKDKKLLKLILEDETKIEFNVGITSTGSFANLTRKKEKRKRRK